MAVAMASAGFGIWFSRAGNKGVATTIRLDLGQRNSDDEGGSRPLRSSPAMTRNPVARSCPTIICVEASHLLQRRREILDQIVRVLQPRREADEAVADAELGARVGLQPLMRGGRRMGDDALGVAEIVGDPCELQRVEAAEGAGLAALHFKPDKRRSGAHLLLDQCSLRMIGPAG